MVFVSKNLNVPYEFFSSEGAPIISKLRYSQRAFLTVFDKYFRFQEMATPENLDLKRSDDDLKFADKEN